MGADVGGVVLAELFGPQAVAGDGLDPAQPPPGRLADGAGPSGVLGRVKATVAQCRRGLPCFAPLKVGAVLRPYPDPWPERARPLALRRRSRWAGDVALPSI